MEMKDGRNKAEMMKKSCREMVEREEELDGKLEEKLK